MNTSQTILNQKVFCQTKLATARTRTYIDLITLVSTNVYLKSFETGLLPDTLYEALISLIPNIGRDVTDPSNFRPMSLINVDSKILSRILVARLEKVLPSIIPMDQVGFVKGRSSSDNMRRLMHLMWY